MRPPAYTDTKRTFGPNFTTILYRITTSFNALYTRDWLSSVLSLVPLSSDVQAVINSTPRSPIVHTISTFSVLDIAAPMDANVDDGLRFTPMSLTPNLVRPNSINFVAVV